MIAEDVAAGSRAREPAGGSGSGPACASSPATPATRPPSPTRSASTAIPSRRRSTPSSGATSPACAPRATRSLVELHEPSAGMPRLLRSWHSAIHNQARRRRAGEEFGRTTCDGTGPFTFVESVAGSHLDVARSDGYSGARTTWQQNHGPAYLDGIRWIPILDDRDRAAALEAGEVDCIQNASLLDVDRLAGEPRPRGDRVPAVGARLPGPRPRGRRARLRGRPRPAGVLARDRPAGARRARPDGPRLARVQPDPVALAVVRARGRGERRLRPAQGGRAARRGRPRGAPGRRAARARDRRRERRHRAPRRGDDPADARRRRRPARAERDRRTSSTSTAGSTSTRRRSSRSGSGPSRSTRSSASSPPGGRTAGRTSSARATGSSTAPAAPGRSRATTSSSRAAARDIQVRAAECLPLIPLFAPAAVWAHHRRVRNWRPNRHDLYPLYGDVWLADALKEERNGRIPRRQSRRSGTTRPTRTA